MRFHHSTRRGRNKFSQGGNLHHSNNSKFGHLNHSLSSRWAQLSYCRQTNIHFNRRLPVDLPEEMRLKTLESTAQKLAGQDDLLAMALAERNLSNGRPNSKRHHLSGHSSPQHHLKQFDQLTLANDHQQDQQYSKQPDEQELENSQPMTSKRQTSVRHKSSSREMEEVDSALARRSNSRPKLDLESAREKLVAQVDKHPFWSTKAAKRMRLLDLEERQIYIYELTSYCERRDLEWRYEPYRGGKLGPSSSSNSTRRPMSSSTHKFATAATTSPSQPQSPSRTSQTPSGGQLTNLEHPLRTPTTDTRPHHFDFESAPTGKTDATWAPHQHHHHHHQNHRPEETSAFALRQNLSHQLQRQTLSSSGGNRLRRSCSSATSSPVRSSQSTFRSNELGNSPTGCSVVQSISSVPIQAAGSDSLETPTTPPASEPRPLANPELVWSIEPPQDLPKPEPFASYLHTSEVPGTSFVKRCHGCEGRGRLKCASCYGVGYEVCLSCTGRGSLRSYSALTSSGSGAVGGGGGLGRSSGRDRDRASEQSFQRNQSSGVTGSMWANASSSSSSRPGGIDSSGQDEPGGGLGSSSASQICANCSGAGQKRCWICAGRSYITCTACAGTGSLRCFQNLNITYTNHRDELCLNNSDGIIPRDRLKLSSGLLLADETAERLEPLTTNKPTATSTGTTTTATATASGPHPSEQLLASPLDGANSNEQQPSGTMADDSQQFNSCHLLEQMTRPGELIQLGLMSAKLLEKHLSTYKHERLIKQRHKVTQIDCYKIDWEFRKKRGHFVVYGDERKVYIAKYPFKSICNIT